MNRLFAALLTGAAVFAAVTAFACGGGGDKKIDLGNGDKVSFSDDLPDDFPIYEGADLQGSAKGESSGINGFIVTWKTGDSLEDVRAFYDEELADGSWASTSSGEQGGNTAFWLAENEDKSKAAYVTITTDGGDTIILVTIGDQDASSGSDDATSDDADSGSDDGDDSSSDGGDSAELLDEVDLSDDFPKDRVPFPDDARVTSSSSFSGGGVKTYLVELNSKDDVGTLADFFTSELEGNGWTESFKTETDGEAFLTFAPGDGADASSESVTVTVSPSDVDGYSDVVIAVSLSE